MNSSTKVSYVRCVRSQSAWTSGLKTLLLLALLLPMTGCESLIGMKEVETRGIELMVCREGVWDPWYWHTDDTDGSIEQAKANNAARLAWGCPP